MSIKEKFETWARSQGMHMTHLQGSNEYESYKTQGAWLAWRAAQSSVPDPCATCNDNGIVGNILNAEPCPDCIPPADEQAQQEPVRWGSPRNVHELIRQLQTLDPTLPIHASLAVDVNGRWRTRIKPLSISYEQITGLWIEKSDESKKAVVIWTNPDQREAQQDAEKVDAQPVDPKTVWMAAINCPHVIDDKTITLHFTDKQEGHGALNQLSRRIEAAMQQGGQS